MLVYKLLRNDLDVETLEKHKDHLDRPITCRKCPTCATYSKVMLFKPLFFWSKTANENWSGLDLIFIKTTFVGHYGGLFSETSLKYEFLYKTQNVNDR